MAESGLLPSYDNLHLCRSVLKRSNFIPRNAFNGICQRKHSYRVEKLFVQLSSCRAWELSAPIVKISRGSQHLREFSLRRCFLGNLATPENVMPLEWVPVVDQVLLMASLVLAYMAGVVPSEKANFSKRNSIAGNNVVPPNLASSGSVARNDQSVNSGSALDEVKTKLIHAFNAIERDGNSDNRAVKSEKSSPKCLLSLYAVDEGPRLRLLWATLQQLEKEVNNISGKCALIARNDWLEVLSKIIQNSSQPICLKWIEDELYLEGRKPEKALLSVMFEKLKDDNTILQNIKKSGKEGLYADVLLFLKFGFLRGVCCYDYKLLTKHGVDILEDLVLTLADGIVGFYLELISVDSNLSSEMNSLGLTMCSLSTRSLQKLRNEVALNQWLHQNMGSIVLMYEDRFELSTLQIQFLEEHKKSGTGKFNWWKKLGLRKSKPTSSPLCDVVISQLSISLKRIKELRALTGWLEDLRCNIIGVSMLKDHSQTTCYFGVGKDCRSIILGRRHCTFCGQLKSLKLCEITGECPDCMAATTTSIQGSSHRSQALLLLLGLLFFILLLAHPSSQSKMISTASSLPTERLLSESSTTTTTQTTKNLHPQHTNKATHHTSSSSASNSRQFEAGKHEVPSGPNPISNR